MFNHLSSKPIYRTFYSPLHVSLNNFDQNIKRGTKSIIKINFLVRKRKSLFQIWKQNKTYSLTEEAGVWKNRVKLNQIRNKITYPNQNNILHVIWKPQITYYPNFAKQRYGFDCRYAQIISYPRISSLLRPLKSISDMHIENPIKNDPKAQDIQNFILGKQWKHKETIDFPALL